MSGPTSVPREEAEALVAALRTGVVPQAGLHHIATGLEPLMRVVEQELEKVAEGQALSKWVRGAYGSGKTFCTRLLCARARAKGFATAEVQISINDTPLHHLETVYRRLLERLTTSADGSAAFKAVVDGWLFEVGEQVTRLSGLSEDDPAFVEAVEAKLEEKLSDLSRQNAAFAHVLRAYYRASEEGALGEARMLLGWLAGQPTTDRSITARAGVKGKVDGSAALAFLRGLLVLLRQSEHAGLVVVLDEVETIQRMPSQTRDKSFDALRQLVDLLHEGGLPGLYLVVTGTPELFDGYKGLRGTTALHQRIATKFGDDPRYDNLRAPQVRLSPFDASRLGEVGRRVRALYPAENPERVRAKVDERFLDVLVRQVTQGFGGDVGVTPRTFLRELVDVMDRVDLHEAFEPAVEYRLHVDEDALTPQELDARRGARPEAPVADVEAPPPGRRRLDG